MAIEEPAAVAIAAVFEDFLSNGLGSAHSARAYRQDWGRFVSWCSAEGLGLLAVTPRDVARYLRSLEDAGSAKATQARALTVIRSVFGALVVEGLRPANPARDVKLKRAAGAKRAPYLEESELAAMLSFHGPSWRDRRDRLCVQLLAGTGWRRAEVARMRCEDFKAGVVTGIVKGGKEARATVSLWLLAEVEAWKEHVGIRLGPLLYRGEHDHAPISGAIVYNIVRRVGAEVGVSATSAVPHALRRTLATLSERHGVPIADIQQGLAHERMATTEGYLKGMRVLKRSPSEWMADLKAPPKARGD